MKNILKMLNTPAVGVALGHFIQTMTLLVLAYAMMAFVLWQADVSLWDIPERGIYVAGVALARIAMYIDSVLEKPNAE